MKIPFLIYSNSKLVIVVIFLCQVLVIFNISPWKNAERENALINWDVTSYYSYLPAVFVHKDLTFKFLETDTINYESKHQFWPETAPNGNKVVKTTMGMAFLYSPFFFVSHLYAHFNENYNANGFSKPYEISLAFSCVFYLLFGFIFLSKLLRTIFSDKITSVILLTTFLGTNLFFYSTTEPCMSHAYTFSIACLLLYLIPKIYLQFNYKSALLLGALIGVLVLIRPTNLLFSLVVLLYGVNNLKSLKFRLIWLLNNKFKILFSICIAFSVYSFQLIYWKWSTGNWIFNSYVGEQFYFDNPQLMSFLFSYRKGWLLYTPIFIISFLGLYKMFKVKSKWTFPIIISLGLAIYIFSSWWCWWYGGGFGMRPMIDFYPLFIIPLGFILQSTKKRLSRFFLIFTIFSCISLNLFQTLQKRHHVIHWDSMTKSSYWYFFFQHRMKSEKDWKVQETLLQTPDYKKAKKGEVEYKFSIIN